MTTITGIGSIFTGVLPFNLVIYEITLNLAFAQDLLNFTSLFMGLKNFLSQSPELYKPCDQSLEVKIDYVI